MNFTKDIQHGVYLKLGPLPQKLTWDIAFARWGSWPHPITWQDHLAAQYTVSWQGYLAAQLHKVPCFMRRKKRRRK